jgi:hypothetical protein
MLVKDLISKLQKVNPEATLTVWQDGESYDLHEVDTLDASDCGTDVQINVKNNSAYAAS